VVTVGFSKDGADDRGHHILRTLRHHGENVPHEMDPTASPAGALERGPEALVRAVTQVGEVLRGEGAVAVAFERAKPLNKVAYLSINSW